MLITGDISRIKKTFDKLKYTSIPIICVGTEAEYDFVKRTFNGYEDAWYYASIIYFKIESAYYKKYWKDK